jgi:hypothetical protein
MFNIVAEKFYNNGIFKSQYAVSDQYYELSCLYIYFSARKAYRK